MLTARLLLVAAVLAVPAAAQTSGNNVYGQNGRANGRSAASEQERGNRAPEFPPSSNSMFVDARVLINVKADEYVAVFAVSRDGTDAADAGKKVDAIILQFTNLLKAMHLRDSDVYVDFIAQPAIYRYDINGNYAKEVLAGFELKKTISVHYTNRDLIDRLVAAATESQIYDLVKVDYVVRDSTLIEARLLTDAASIIKQKLAADDQLLGIKTLPVPQIYEQRTAIHYPTELYDSYTAAEGQVLNRPNKRDPMTIQEARKVSTFYFNGLDGNGFDKVVNPVLSEPVVQFTFYLKLKYELARPVPAELIEKTALSATAPR